MIDPVSLVLIVVLVGVLSIAFTKVLCDRSHNDLIDSLFYENIIVDRSKLDANILRDWDQGLSVLSFKFTYKTLPTPSKLRIVKSETNYNNKDKGGPE